MIQLYEHAMSPYVQKVKIALREKHIDFSAHVPDELGSGAAAGEFVEVNPRAEVPALIDGDACIFDSTIILDYIEDKWPSPPLLPTAPADRARSRMIEEVCDTHYEAILWGLYEITWFKRAQGDLADTLSATARRQHDGMLRWLTRHLGDREWFGADCFDRADLSVLPHLWISARFGLAPAPDSPLSRWLQRASSRPSARLTIEEGDQAAKALQERRRRSSVKFRREYRDHRLEWMIKSGGINVVVDGLAKDNIRFSADFG